MLMQQFENRLHDSTDQGRGVGKTLELVYGIPINTVLIMLYLYKGEGEGEGGREGQGEREGGREGGRERGGETDKREREGEREGERDR